VTVGEPTLTPPEKGRLVLGPQVGAVVGTGISLGIQAGPKVNFTLCAEACAHSTKRSVFALCADADSQPSASLPAEVMLVPAPQCRSDDDYNDDVAVYGAGTCGATPYH